GGEADIAKTSEIRAPDAPPRRPHLWQRRMDALRGDDGRTSFHDRGIGAARAGALARGRGARQRYGRPWRRAPAPQADISRGHVGPRGPDAPHRDAPPGRGAYA